MSIQLNGPIEVGVIPARPHDAEEFVTAVLGFPELSRMEAPDGGTLVRFDAHGAVLKLMCTDHPPERTGGYGSLLVPTVQTPGQSAGALGLDIHTVPELCGAIGTTVSGPDVEALRQFWGDHLNFEQLDEDTFVNAGVVVKVVQGEAPERARLDDLAGLRYLTLVVSDVDASVAPLAERGVKFPLSGKDLPNGARIALAVDPAGHWIEFGSYPKS